MKMDEAQELLETGLECIKIAEKEALKSFGKNPKKKMKSDNSWVTEVDENIEAMQRSFLLQKYPHHKILGEEMGGNGDLNDTTHPYRWVLDPIDGTFSFMNAIPFYSSLICLFYQNVPYIGIASLPSLGIRFWAIKGGGAYVQLRGGKPKSLSKAQKMGSLEITAIADPYRFSRAGYGEVLKTLFQEPSKIRIYPDALGYYLLLTNAVNMFIDPLVKLWDIAPFHVILPEANFRIHSWEGPQKAFGNTSVAYPAQCSKVVEKHLSLLKLS